MLLLLLCVMNACGKQEKNEPFTYRAPAAKQEQETADTEETTPDYIIEQIDMMGETMTLYSPKTERQVRYGYTLSTRFMDAYGDSYSSIHFTPGQVVRLGEISASSTLSTVQMSDEVWNQKDITNYEIDIAKGIFTIGQTAYRITPDTMAFSQDAQISLDAIGAEDTLQVIGKDKDVWSVIVTTGHGYIQLQNSDTFVDSMICIGNRIFTEVTGDMCLEVPEGTYAITVANNGYGGTGNYTVTRGETTVVDLNQLKGSGPKVCQLTFTSEVAGVSVYVDGEQITVGQAVPVTYGAHKLRVVAEGYDDWQKTLIVNSESATISLDMAQTEDAANTSQSSENTTQSTGGNTSNSTSNSTSNRTSNSTSNSTSHSSSSNSNKNSKNKNKTDNRDKDTSSNDSSSSSSNLSDTETDYLTTISKMLSTLLD